MRSKRGWIKTLALISLACVALLTIEGVADYLEAWKRSAEEKARFRPGSIHTVIQTINLCDEDGVPVRQVSPGDLIGIEKRGFGRRMVYVVSQLPTVRGWVDFGILKASTREGSPWEKEEDR